MKHWLKRALATAALASGASSDRGKGDRDQSNESGTEALSANRNCTGQSIAQDTTPLQMTVGGPWRGGDTRR